MDWLTRLPAAGPVFARLMRTHAWRSWVHYDAVRGDRLAGAATFFGFLAVFPTIALSAALTAAALSEREVRVLEREVRQQFPFVSDQLDLDGLVRNAATVGLIGGVLLLWAGLRWVEALRGCLRVVWGVDDGEDNVLAGKGRDLVALLGLGGAFVLSVAASGLATALVGQVAGRFGIEEDGVGVVLLGAAGIGVGVVADFLLVLYLLRWLPGLHPARRPLLQAALIAAVGIELLKLLLSGYLGGVASRSMYGAFGAPVALLLWLNLMTRLLLYCSAWTATATAAAPGRAPGEAAAAAVGRPGATGVTGPASAAASGSAGACAGTPEAKPREPTTGPPPAGEPAARPRP